MFIIFLHYCHHVITFQFVDPAVNNSFASNPRHSLLDASNRHRPTGRRGPPTEDVVQAALPGAVETKAIMKHVAWIFDLHPRKFQRYQKR